ncbi:MAG: UvrD-helicase domain-containing protein, partial [Spirochaetaceae bacterium]|nr:UvrD-helicase domain-containing protein [Spirochaetaceae bacterium]
AGAGAVKTSSIKDRVLNLLTKGEVAPERLVVITYTTKAANELINRIREVLEQNLGEPKVEEALQGLKNAKISTVHSFCYDLLREYPLEFPMDPDLQMADEKTTALMLDHCFHQMELELSEEQNISDPEQKAFQDFMETRDSETQGTLRTTLLEFYKNRDLSPVSLDSSAFPQRSHLLTALEQALKEYYHLSLELHEDIKEGCEGDGFYVFLEEYLLEVLQKNNPEEFIEGVKNNSIYLKVGRAAQKNYHHKEKLAELKEHFKAFSHSKSILDCLDLAENYIQARKIYPYFEKTVEEYKKLYGFIDFFDCLYLLKKGLEEKPALSHLVQSRFDGVIIDEFQDSDPMQAEIAFLLAGDSPGKLFFVGDPKQSIYGFARADIQIYQETGERIKAEQGGEILELQTNFRSSGGLLDFINHSFSTILADLGYRPMVTSPRKAEDDFFAEHWHLNPLREGEGKLNAGDRRERESAIMAREIHGLMAEKALQPQDILLLFRSSTAMDSYQRALENLGIPVVNYSSRNFLKRQDVLSYLNLLSLCAYPADCFYRFAVDKSPLFEFDDDELDRVLEGPGNLLMKFRTLFQLSGLPALALEKGRDEQLHLMENLCALVQAELESNGHNLKRTLADLRDKALEEGFSFGENKDDVIYLQRRQEQAVRLMTIHSSKGLQSKVVILIGHEASNKTRPVQVVDRSRGEVLVKTPFLSRAVAEALELTAINGHLEKADTARIEEEKRLLYVAVTRAEQGFVLLSSEGVKKTPFMDPLLESQPLFSQSKELGLEVLESSEPSSEPLPALSKAPHKQGKLQDLLMPANKVSQAVTTMIENPALFQQIQGRKQGMEFGTLVHGVMEKLCPLLWHDRDKEQKRIPQTDLLVDRVYSDLGIKLPSAYLEEIKAMAGKFVLSPLAEEIRSAYRVETELPFLLLEEYHGTMDLILETEDEIRVLDFKSDLLREHKEEIMAHYDRQLELYTEALKKLVDKPVRGECVYLFSI